MPYRRLLPLALLLVALAACGSSVATAPARSLADSTATATAARTTATTRTTVTGPTASVTTARASAAPSIVPAINPTPNATQIRNFPTATSGTPAASRPATARPVASVTPQPNGTVPAGWKIYRGGADFPFVVAYPPDWTFDESLLPEQKIVYFYGPEGLDNERIDIEFGQTQTGDNIDVQRDTFFYKKSEFCDQKGIEYTSQRQISGVAFAILGATCDSSNELTFMQVASGLVGGDEWNVLMRTLYDHKDERLRTVFDPMLATLNVYAAVP
ncbi:MAG: hypothetical protein U0841_23230 [Chloroflexia bacterium]